MSFDTLSSAMARSVLYGLLIQRDGQILFANDKAARIVGLEGGEDLRGRPFARFVDKKDLPCFKEKLVQGMASHVIFSECRLIGVDGYRRSVDVEILPLSDDRVGQSLLVLMDLSVRKGIEHSHWESEKKHWELFNALSEGVVVHEIENGQEPGQISEVNDFFCMMIGRPRDELLASNMIDLVGQGDRSKARELYGDLLEKGKIDARLSLTRVDGKPLPVEISVRVVSLWDRPVALGVFRDLSSIFRLKGEMESLERRYRSFFSNLSDAFALYEVVRDEKGHPWMYRFSQVNRPYLDLLGLEEDEVLGKNVLDVAPDGDILMLPASYKVALSGKPMRFEHHSIIKNAFWTVSVFSPDRGYVAVVLCDVTSTRKLEAQGEVFERLETLGKTTAGVAHDFSNHLVGIMSYATSISRSSSDPSARVMASRVMDIASKANDLIKRLLAISQKGEISFHKVDLHEVIREAVELLAFGWDERFAIRLSLDSPSGEIVGNGSQIYNALSNLLINGTDFMPEGGIISVSTDLVQLEDPIPPSIQGDLAPGYYVKVSVADRGRGIAPRDLPRIFDPFFTTKPQGTGMGLPMVFATAQAHNGGIEVHSVPRKGTVFSLYFPIEGSVTLLSEQALEGNLSGDLAAFSEDPDPLGGLLRELELHRPKGAEEALVDLVRSGCLDEELASRIREHLGGYRFDLALKELQGSR
ncbi:PAS domain-containing sensor histidine kinase [Dethiosulfovibrio salsuginis]|uniref:histidine kinase n=1 Tax=Dethiosulfovibrio salsuginis TaxID=561720 RepID=A0A1X7KIB6_9BACT|nr:PAS domain S-box protein [Dethiosulfovibrio salsuginis]SMG41125.1 PAS domain S-box-containing protein [Dethiosulfovibrio salsuginis]